MDTFTQVVLFFQGLFARMMFLAKTPLITTEEIPLELKAARGKDAFYGAKDEKKPFKDFMRTHGKCRAADDHQIPGRI
jgi:hypothetical protein